MAEPRHRDQNQQMRVVIVGPCASGKSTLVDNLRALGYDAYACAQEHSAAPNLWAHQDPDMLIALRTDLLTIRQRRGEHWSEAIYKAQLERLQVAYESADLTIDTGEVGAQTALKRSIAFLEGAVIGHRQP